MLIGEISNFFYRVNFHVISGIIWFWGELYAYEGVQEACLFFTLCETCKNFSVNFKEYVAYAAKELISGNTDYESLAPQAIKLVQPTLNVKNVLYEFCIYLIPNKVDDIERLHVVLELPW